MSAAALPRDLGDGLQLRWATKADTDRIALLNAQAFRENEADPPLAVDLVMLTELMSGRHPLVRAEDFVLVEDRTTGKVVSSACLFRQDWEYDGIPFAVGRPEHVATDAAYRNRGLVRAIFDALHARSAAYQHHVQAITGIPYFYRQFGYEYVFDLDGGQIVYPTTLPAPVQPAPYSLRDATPADLPFIQALYDQQRQRSLVSAQVPDAYWRYAFADFSTPQSLLGGYNRQWCLRIIVDPAGEAVGYLRTGVFLWEDRLYIWDLATTPGVPLRDAAIAALQQLVALGPTIEQVTRSIDPAHAHLKELFLCMESRHPLYTILGERIAPRAIAPYAWYVRVPDLPQFLQLIGPALERRLAASPLANHSGDLRLDFYRDGLKLSFAQGKLTAVAPWRRPAWGERQHAGFPPHLFLQLLFGYRSLAALRATFPDVRATTEAAVLLDILFPQQYSRVIALD